MSSAVVHALAVRRDYGLVDVPTDDDLARVCAGEGLTLVLNAPELIGRVKEVLIGDCLCLAKGLDRRERRWLIAHGLGHWRMHEPTLHFYLRDRQIERDRQEWQAELFAGWFLWCDGPILPMGVIAEQGVTGLAELGQVPYEAAQRWLAMALPGREMIA